MDLYIHVIFLLLIKIVPNHLKDEHGSSEEYLSSGELERDRGRNNKRERGRERKGDSTELN